LLGNCANTNTYEYTQQDVDQIFSAIETELREAKDSDFFSIMTAPSTYFDLII